jgi:DNA mismatch endonuclease (patch repair protein)
VLDRAMPHIPPPRPDFVDVLPSRRRNMSAIRGRDTEPERWVRSLLHSLGYRFRLHKRHLPGRPDIVFPGRRKVIFVHGCFWHRHGCQNSVLPRTRSEWWAAKLGRNAERDAENIRRLTGLGWEVEIVWECEVRASGNKLADRLQDFLGPPGALCGRGVL